MNLSWGLLHAGLQTLLDTALDAVIVMNDDGQVVGWNGNAERTFGWTADEALGKRLSELVIPDRYREAHERGLKHFLATGEGPVLNRHIEIEGATRDGAEVPIELSITATEQFGDRVFVGFLRDISERKAQSERQQRILQESEHRVKNMLTVVAAIAQQTARVSPDMDSFSKSFAGRLESLARAHELLVGQVWRDIALSALAERVLGADVALGRARYGGPEILLKPGQVLGLSMILHELYTNAIKYGALCNDEGRLDVDWAGDDGTVELTWKEQGPPCESDSPSSGFGNRMIAMSVKSDLKGTIERDWRPDGLTAVLRFPVDD
ncbi:MAG: PAS domain S-box protein [Sphingomonas sp.]|nr:PAS domain S-box protein [Sphingomonas sp.]